MTPTDFNVTSVKDAAKFIVVAVAAYAAFNFGAKLGGIAFTTVVGAIAKIKK